MIKVSEKSTNTNGFYKALSCLASSGQEVETLKGICPMWATKGFESDEGLLGINFHTDRAYDRHGVAHNTGKAVLRPLVGTSISSLCSTDADQTASEIRVSVTRQGLNGKWVYSATVEFAEITGLGQISVSWNAKISPVSPSSCPVGQLAARAIKEALKTL